MELPIRWVETYVAVVEHGHFGAAARALHLSPSAVSKHVRGLEHEVGAQLLDRRPGSRVMTTEAGARLVVAAQALLRAHANALASVRSATPSREVRLGVLAGVPFSSAQVDFLRTSVALRSPGWWVGVHRVPFTATTDCLLDRAVDVLWTGHPPRDPRISAVPVGRLERWGLVGRRHPLGEAAAVSGEVFAELPLLHDPRIAREWMEPFVLDDVRPAREARLVAVAAADYGTVLEHVRTGRGVAVTVGALPASAPPSVVAVRLDGVPPMTTHAAYRTTDRREVVRELLAALADLRLGSGAREGTTGRIGPGPTRQLVPSRKWSET